MLVNVMHENGMGGGVKWSEVSPKRHITFQWILNAAAAP